MILNADVVRFTSEIFAQWENNISFCVTGASVLLALSVSLCPQSDSALGWYILAVNLRSCIIFIDGIFKVSVISVNVSVMKA